MKRPLDEKKTNRKLQETREGQIVRRCSRRDKNVNVKREREKVKLVRGKERER